MEIQILPLMFIGISLLLLLLIVIYTIINGIPPMPTSPAVKRIIIETLAELNSDGIICELGSGWGSLATAIAKKLPQSTVLAFENSPVPYIYSALASKIASPKNLRVVYGNIFTIPLENASIVFCYLSRKHMDRLKVKLLRELPKGAIIISSTFGITGWIPFQQIQVKDLYRTIIHLYNIDAIRATVEFTV